MSVICPDYMGVACTDGSYTWDGSCEYCRRYQGCRDCAWCDEDGECMVVRENEV